MRKRYLTVALLCAATAANAQMRVATNALYINPVPNVTIPYQWDGEGKSLPISWGYDTAWEDEYNIRIGLCHVDKNLIDVVRVSFRPDEPLANGTDLTSSMKTHINNRLKIARLIRSDINLSINSDHGENNVDDWYHGTSLGPVLTSSNEDRWVQNIKKSIELYEAKGNKVVTVAPFNEPDFGWNQGTYHKDNKNNTTKEEMRLICKAMKADSFFDGRRISGGNTLNCDCASEWYNYLKEYLDEGNTHQLAGDFNHYADFFTELRNDGMHATADELHNIMEAFVGVEYGMQTGIWWGTTERARAELMRASQGVRLGYGENRGTWMAGAVYRNADNQIKAFIGQSERQATTTTFAFRSDRNVFYDGQGPLREFYVSVTGGTGYQQGTTSGERVYDVTTGPDIAPVIDGTYYIVNRATGHRLMVAPNNDNGTALTMANYTGKTSQQWEVHPMPDTRGGDYSYHSFRHVSSQKAADVKNFSISSGEGVILYDFEISKDNQAYWLEYADDGYFYIRNQRSAMCLQAGASVGSEITQRTYKKGTLTQQWRFIPVGVKPEFEAPAAPAGLVATPQGASISLEWDAVEGDDTFSGYNILRSTGSEDGYELIARGLTCTTFVDHDVQDGQTYYYKVKATDTSFNTSGDSDVVSGQVKGGDNMIAAWSFDTQDSLYDATENRNDILTFKKPTFSTGKIGKSLFFNGTEQYAQLPYSIASHQSLTFSAWVKWSGGSSWQRIFDFGNDTDHYLFLTPSNGSDMVLGIKNGGEEEKVTCQKLSTNKWAHVAVTFGTDGVTIYVDGQPAASSSTISIRPEDILPAFNYLGRSQFKADPLFKGYMDDVRIYNHALTAQQVADIYSMTDGIDGIDATADTESPAYDLGGRMVNTTKKRQIYIINGNKTVK